MYIFSHNILPSGVGRDIFDTEIMKVPCQKHSRAVVKLNTISARHG